MTNVPATEPETADAADHRQATIDGLRALATFLQEHPDVPVPPYTTTLLYHADGTDEEQYAEVDRVAALLDVTPTANAKDTHYRAARSFGPITYEALAIRAAYMRRMEAANSYYGVVEPDDEAVTA
jgi:hypothetical protein